MSTGTERAGDGRIEGVDDGFLKRNAWIKPFLLVEAGLFALLILIDIANDFVPAVRGGFSEAIFGMVFATIVLTAITAVVVLAISGVRYLLEG
ncbi:hypothetical protein [Haloarchaeobius sp. DFWS5]|uniref:hypothetical protein n=1 Tax=Haloarchaeobius sp. DFWS5 TaxID=3446114 RepID=UPI003EBDEEE1